MDATYELSMKGLYKPSIIVEIGNKKIGIVGYIGQDAEVKHRISISNLSSSEE